MYDDFPGSAFPAANGWNKHTKEVAMSVKCLCVLLAAVLIVPAAAAQISPDARLFQNPERDGAVFTGMYLDGQVRYQQWKGNNKSWMIGPTFALTFPDLPQLETGARVFMISYNPRNSSSKTAASDINLWGKYQFLDDPVLLSAGLLFTLPTGSEKVLHPESTGEINLELFGAARYYVTDMLAVIGNIGLRINSDMNYKVEEVKTDIKGETQFLIGAGFIVQATPEMDVLAELNFATEAYRGWENDVELTGGVQYYFNPDFCGRGGIGVGLDDGAPRFEMILGVSAFF